jgi:hypothetical protein
MQTALEKYKSANQLKAFYFSANYNYTICAVKSGEFKKSFDPVTRLLEMGVPMSFFERKSDFAEFIKSSTWKRIVEDPPLPTYSEELRDELEVMLEWDQEFRGAYRENYDTISKIDSINGMRIMELLEDYGSISSQHVGVRMLNDTALYLGWSDFSILLIHQVKRDRTMFSKYLRSLVLRGRMSPSDYAARSVDFSPLDSIRLNCYQQVGAQLIQVRDTLYICSDEDIKLIDAQRAELYLPSLADQRKKIEYYYEKDRSFLISGHAFTFSGVVTDEEADPIIKDLRNNGFIPYKVLLGAKSYYLLNKD